MFEGFKKEQAVVKEEVFNAVFFLLVLVIMVSTSENKKGFIFMLLL